MAIAPRYLTKSRFKLAAECPTKLYFVGKSEYLDRSAGDSFLAALAEGGYQVGELACLMHPEGVRVDDLNHQSALEQTADLLKQDNVTIFEAALAVDRLFIRVDILKKVGNDVEIIEVKAKSYNAKADGDFRGAKGQLRKEFLPYLRDVAFQRYVASHALPGCRVRAFLMLVDKEQYASVDGLNQRFKARRAGGRLRIDVAPGTDANTLGTSLLAKVAVDGQVDEILHGGLGVGHGQVLPFPEAVKNLAQAYANDIRITPTPSTECGSCQFKADKWPANGEPKSGFHECWASAFNWGPDDFSKGTVLDLWYFTGKAKLIAHGVLKPSQVTIEDLGFDGQAPGVTGMSRKHRQWYICKPDWPGGGEFFFDKEGFRAAQRKWSFPLHCIDFETSAVAIPFVKGRRPYETTAFQFSHHVIDETGKVSHRTQWISAEPGVDPNFDFVRALRNALVNDNGTIFRWAAHENSVLNQLRAQLLSLNEPPPDRDGLVSFIESITTRAGDGKEKVAGPRNMVDLCELAEKFYFHPSTKGSTSLKKVLPALMCSSDFLRDRYGKPTYGGTGVSLNFEQPIAWWQMHDGTVVDPYLLLPPIFEDVSQQEIEAVEAGLSEDLREGGAAMAAYGRLQFEDLPTKQREAICAALLRYCELDTLAMVMAVQAWTEWMQE
ncbi:DUF2779 domain-containing protein [Aromatoleum toluclasticum]|uniref:DUF2779 domain-containing protein n=1 Tax=Aromatoleum toluclasticum TaxID=92003 RepID=UPI00036DC313|nr:DUF2779 domain-containing protein [Aromatoleum toluclasticum]